MAQLLPDVEERILLSPYDLVSLKDARVPAGAFAMRPVNESHVQQLVESDPSTWPAIVVTLCTQGYIVIDGYHRWRAATIKQVTHIKATCIAFPNENAVVEAAFKANLTHGLKASIENRSDYAYWLHVSYPDLDQREIALRTGMTQGGVSKAIQKRDEQARQAMQDGENGSDREASKKSAKRSCKHFTKAAIRFVDDVQILDDEELLQLLSSTLKSEDQEKLARIGRLFYNPETPQTTGPLRLRQFAQRSS